MQELPARSASTLYCSFSTVQALSCVHNQIATFGLLSRQSVTLNIGLNIGCSHNRNNQPSEQSAKCNIGQALAISSDKATIVDTTEKKGNKAQVSKAVANKFPSASRCQLRSISLI